ncbi:MAG TPA: GNAT family N-acetyltransferase [Acidimicrobiia bacterium]|nr:GNAT family N-acetyltransferase [Acidimicrobiia bacterium]
MDDHVRGRVLSAEHITIEPARLDQLDAEALVGALLDELRERYGEEDPDHPSVHELAGPAGGTFLLARVQGRPVGCGGLRRHDDGVAELKRMYVVPEERRRGVAQVLLAALEAQAGRLGYHAIVLETGVRQPEALSLYEGHGYDRIANFGPYVDAPLSVCLRKELRQAGSNSTGSALGPRNA